MEAVNSILSGVLLPALLILCGIWFGIKLRFFYVLHPIKLTRRLFEASDTGGTSPFRALTVALAGTLGVGNMAGVATAITAGGAGALFWMWLSAICAMSIKYIEVCLALETRKKANGRWRGGAMYYIKEIFNGRLGSFLSSLFALLCIGNSLLTGNIVQVNSAASAISAPPLAIGAAIGIIGMLIATGGGKRISDTTLFLIPLLSISYIIICLAVIFNNIDRIPQILEKIATDAFSLRSASGGIMGFTMLRAVRYGVTRGIFSNEAGCGTSPTAHAEADARSPHHQGCFGIFEVFADTIVLCTMTGFVILLAGESHLDGIPLTLYAFGTLAGEWAKRLVALSVMLFALATVISQASYGLSALSFLSRSNKTKALYLSLIPVSSIIGAVISSDAMWQIADLVISVMTAINLFALSFYVKRRKTPLVF